MKTVIDKITLRVKNLEMIQQKILAKQLLTKQRRQLKDLAGSERYENSIQ